MNSTLIETIRVTDGQFHLLNLHRTRMRHACRELFDAAPPELNLSTDDIPAHMRKGTVKCRIIYGREIQSVEFSRYTPRHIDSLRLIHVSDIDYHLKYADRRKLEEIHNLREESDEVVIVRDGLITDTSYSNILCRAGNTFLTPAEPLLRGVMRRELIDRGIAKEAHISPDMLRQGNSMGITEVFLINAMMPPGTLPPVPISRIIHDHS